jgi:hypothetical protein
MSTSLRWRPPGYATSLPDELKFKLRDEYQLPTTMGAHDLPFLKGLMVCDIDGAKELYEAIENNGEVEVFED